MADEKPIIVIKKKGGHGGHHGGAWKVAYADFVTAMMAFFMVMWLVNSAEVSVRQNIASYFRKPGLFASGSGTPLLIGQAGILEDAFSPPHPSQSAKSAGKSEEKMDKKSGTEEEDTLKTKVKRGGEANGLLRSEEERQGLNPNEVDPSKKSIEEIPDIPKVPPMPNGQELEKFSMEKIAKQIREQIEASPELQKLLGIVDVKVDADGLNIEIMDSDKSSMFSSGSPRILPDAQEAFEKLASLMLKLPNKIEIVGHTDAKPFTSRTGGYTNWELSADRANAARRVLEESGIAPDRIASVVGRADQEPRVIGDPLAAANRRITLKMKFNFNKTINLGKDPNALEHINDAPPPVPSGEGAQVAGEDGAIPGMPIEAPSVAATPAPIHGFRPKKLIQANSKENLAAIPEDSPASIDPDPRGTASAGKDKIFGGSPVIGSSDIFSGN